MTRTEMEAAIAGRLRDPFSVLGPHMSEGDEWQIRAFLPHASEASVVIDGETQALSRLHPQGVFGLTLAADPGDYSFRLKLWDGSFKDAGDPYRFPPQLSDYEIYLHGEGTNYESYRTLGAHVVESDGTPGVRFAVWAPNADVVSLVGDFNEWDSRRNPMRLRNGGIWEIFMPGLGPGANYKYSVRARATGYQQMKADPYGFEWEVPPKSASIVHGNSTYEWEDAAWMEARAKKDYLREPVSVYEVHLGSWLRGPKNTTLTYRQLAVSLVDYVLNMGYTHIQLMPLMEHPFSGSWGYQVIGYYGPTSRFGSPEDFKFFVDRCHREGIGVLMDWVPAHFPKDAHGLARFDGTACYEHEDPREGEHRDWGTLIFNFGRNEVRTFLISNAMFWLKEYHIDGLRVDAVASMLYRDYSRKQGEWIPNQYGGNENLEAIDFLRRFNELAHTVPGAITVAEESTSFSGVSRPVYLNGLGFTMKWNMGWMNDILHYFSEDSIHRKYHHNDLTFSLIYAFTENFVLPISHDEVVHGKGSLISKMPGDYWQKFANVRAFLAFMYGHPGKKLLFMGCEIGQWDEWNHDLSVQWHLLGFPLHEKLRVFTRDLNRLYQDQPALWEVDFHYSGFEWVDFHDVDQSIIAFVRRPRSGDKFLMFCCNFTPVPRTGYRFKAPVEGVYREIFNSDAECYGGSNMGNGGSVASQIDASRGGQSIAVTLPPLSVVVFASPDQAI